MRGGRRRRRREEENAGGCGWGSGHGTWPLGMVRGAGGASELLRPMIATLLEVPSRPLEILSDAPLRLLISRSIVGELGRA